MSILKTHLKMHLYSWAFDPESGTDLTCYFYIVVLSISVVFILFIFLSFSMYLFPFFVQKKGIPVAVLKCFIIRVVWYDTRCGDSCE